MEDEQVRQALERGCDRSDIIDVLGISRRTTFNKQKRACAYGFPLSAFNRGGRPTDSERSERSSVTADTDTGEADGQQRLDAVPDKDPDSLGRTETWGAADSESEAQSTGVMTVVVVKPRVTTLGARNYRHISRKQLMRYGM